MSYKDNGTACPLCDLPDGFHNRPHLVGTVHIHTLSKVSLHRIEDKHLGTALHDGFFNSFVQHMQRFFFLANIDDAFLVCACFYETRLDGIVETVLCRLIDHRYGCNGIHVRQRRSGGAGGGKAEREEVVLPSPGSPCMIVSLPKGIYGYHSQSTSRTWMSDILSSFSSSFFIIFFLSVLCWSVSFGTIIAIPPFIKIHFRFADHGSVLREKVHSPSSLSAVFTCTPDIVPTLTLTMFRVGVCALLAVSSFEGASSAPFSYGTILRIAVIAKSTAAYPVGRLFSCV